MNLSTIEQGEELLKKVSDAEWNWDANNPQHQLLAFLIHHASELLQCAREVEERRKAMMFCSGPCNPSFTRAQIDVENNEAPVLSLDDYKRWT